MVSKKDSKVIVAAKGSKEPAKAAKAPVAAAEKKVVKKASAAAEKQAKREAAKKAIKDDPGFELTFGVPESKYFHFEDKNIDWLFSAMFGTPGIMLGKIIEIAGKSDVGKSALARTLTAKAQAQGVKGFDIDVEKSLTKEFADKLGMKTKELLLIKPDHGEGAMKGLRKVIQEYGGRFGVLDSSTACLPRAETNDEGGGMGAQARMMAQEMRKVDKIVDKHGAILIIISQVKTKPGMAFGNPEYISSGGSAVGFHSRIRLTISKVEVLKDEKSKDAAMQKQETGYTARILITKNHTGAKRTTPFDLVVDNLFRFDMPRTAIAWAKKYKLIDEKAKTISGVPFSGAGNEKQLIEAIAGQEYKVFREVDAIFRAREDGLEIDFENQDDTTDKDNGFIADPDFAEIKVDDEEEEDEVEEGEGDAA